MDTTNNQKKNSLPSVKRSTMVILLLAKQRLSTMLILMINEFLKPYKEKGFSELKQTYIRELLLFISQNGSFERSDLLLPELTFDGILDSEEILGLLEDIESRL